jgi:CheY-like chemotaxis protein
VQCCAPGGTVGDLDHPALQRSPSVPFGLMSQAQLQLVNLALGSLEEDSTYLALAEFDTDEDFNDFRSQVETIRARCLISPFHPRLIHEVRELLVRLHADSRGTLGRFRPFVEKALIDLGAVKSDAVPERTEPERTAPRAAPRRRILLVDDDPDVLRALGTALTKAGYEVVPAVDGGDAVRQWRELHGGDLVILDMFMPEKDGLQTIVELRSHSPGVPIIAISGGGTTGRLDILEDARLLGAVETFEKPFSIHALLALVARLIANSR